MCVIFLFIYLIFSSLASLIASFIFFEFESLSGSITAKTFSFPIASEHNFKTTAESSPPLSPTTAPSFLSFATYPLMKSFIFSVFDFKSISRMLLIVSSLFFKNITNIYHYSNRKIFEIV